MGQFGRFVDRSVDAVELFVADTQSHGLFIDAVGAGILVDLGMDARQSAVDGPNVANGRRGGQCICSSGVWLVVDRRQSCLH